ncbi:biotin transport system substrate-specific component [Tessaracoccus bendigoensis DSM 12906]|uniref:Biotin transporter n=1 Tax=Tessaracoccus bendigoensis DSM 12906 TaxID=1123357 RepID=A0A1M6LE62_9ACTN|nr:biotin transporter BioY [Tessaracoccus bendigoensis]SHJ69493.1 biotin transport system substrate-specific component [Tessaracoccus bendigoensis DSM 12906]
MTTQSASRPRAAIAPMDLAYIAVFAALLAAMSLTPAIPVAGLPAPITLQTLGVMLAGLCLGAWRGAAAVGLYLLVGLAGIPVFAGGAAGIAPFVGPTGGYLVSFLISAFVIGLAASWIVRRADKLRFVWFVAACLVSRVVVIWPLGVFGMARALGKPMSTMWVADLAFWPGDVIKTVIACLIAVAVHKAFPRLLGR